MKVKQFGVQTMIKIEFLYNDITGKTGAFVWCGMKLLHSEYVDSKIDAYEMDGLIERFERDYNESCRIQGKKRNRPSFVTSR